MRRKDEHQVQVEQAFLERLEKGLVTAEAWRVLACSLLAHDTSGRDRLYQRLGEDPDTVEVLRGLFAPPRKGRAARPVVVGKAKFKQQWDALWREWDDCVVEASYEESKYIEQDHHWEPQYFCADSLSSDLDDIAKRMRALVPRIQKERLDTDLSFLDRIRTLADSAASGLPEGLEETFEGLSLGPHATCCLLEWEIHRSQTPKRTTFELLDSLCELETGDSRIGFDHAQIRRFVVAHGETECRAILAEIAARRSGGHWAKALEKPWSGWFKLLQHLSQRWDKSFHLELCAAHVGKDWLLALPVVRKLLTNKNYDSALTVLDTAFRTMIGRDSGQNWDPRTSLLARHWRFDGDTTRAKAAEELLRARQAIADARRELDIIAAIGVQVTALRDPEDGAAMLTALRSITAPKFAAVRHALLGDWRNLVVGRTLGIYEDPSQAGRGGWVEALVDAAIQGVGGAAKLKTKVREVLSNVAKDTIPHRGGGHFSDPYTWKHRQNVATLARLTLDLDAGNQLKDLAPTLHGLLREHAANRQRNKLDAVRRRWFRDLGGDQISDDVMQFWRQNVVQLVPDPATCDYEVCVQWLAAAQEVDKDGGRELLRQWSTKHALKRNLWKTVAIRGLPVPSGVKLGEPKRSASVLDARARRGR